MIDFATFPGRLVRTTACVAMVASFVSPGVVAQGPPPLTYPPTPRGTTVDETGGVRVADPYRWLESITSPEVRGWTAAENAVTESYLARLPRRAEIQHAVSWASAYVKTGSPFTAGERLFFEENSGLDNQPALWVRERRETPPRVLLDPNLFSRDGLIAVVDRSASPDGRYLAYATTVQGSAWRTVRVREVRTSKDLPDELRGIKDGPLAWTRDERGFFYTRTDGGHPAAASNPLAPDGRQQLYYHRVGHKQGDDDLIFENARHAEWRIRGSVTDDGQYLVIATRTGSEQANRVFFIDLDSPDHPNLGAPLVTLFNSGDAVYDVVGNAGAVFFLRTTKNAPRGRLVAVDINAPDEKHWTPVVRESYDPMVEVRRVDDRLLVHRLHDAHSVLELYALDGGVRGTVALPGVGTVTGISGRAGIREFYFQYSSVLQPPEVYKYDLDLRSPALFREVTPDSGLAGLETTQLFFTSTGGTRIPMWVTARRGITLDGSHPALLTAYGSFSVAETPVFAPDIAAWLQLGGIYATANVRGGGEYGRAWYDAALGPNKPVAVADLEAAADFLITQHYTSAGSLAVRGRGAGALVAGAALLARPELFGAAVLDAGLLDLTRFPRFTGGAGWTPEFGSPDGPAELSALLRYSPLQNVKAGVRYPPVLLTVGDHDEVVTPVSSYKFAAALQAAGGASGAPALLRVDLDAGHGPGTPVAKLLALESDQLAFLVAALHVK